MCDKNPCGNCNNGTASCAYGYDWSGGRAPCGPCRPGDEHCASCTSTAPCAKCAGYRGNYGGLNQQQAGCCGGKHPCSGCNVHLSHHQCQWCANSRGSQQAWSFYNDQRTAAFKSGDPVIPPSGNPNFDPKGAWNPYGRSCYLNQPANNIVPPGLHLCKVAEPNTWTALPNWIPCSAAINWYHERSYINDLYDTTRSKPFCGPGCNPADPGYVQNAYQWPPPVPMNDVPPQPNQQQQ